MRIMKNRNKKSIILVTTVILLILFGISINLVSAAEYWGYDTGKRAHAYDSSKDEQAIAFQTRILFSRENSGDSWKLSEIKLYLLTSLKDDGIDGSFNYWVYGGSWKYFIDEVKFEVKIERYIMDPAEKIWIIEPLSGSALAYSAHGVGEGSAGSNDPRLEALFYWAVTELIDLIPYFGELASSVFSFVIAGTASSDSFTTGTTSDSRWCSYEEGYMQEQETLGIRVYLDATQTIYKSTHPYFHHRITIKYTVVTKSIGNYWALGVPYTAEYTEWTITNQVVIQI